MRREYIDSMPDLHATWLSQLGLRFRRQQQNWLSALPSQCAVCGRWPGPRICHDCRALLADTATEGYVLLDMYDLENIQAFVVANGAEHTIRDYSVSIYKDKENGGLEVVFRLDAPQYHALSVGDRGMLSYKGTAFVAFTPDP